jgi:hypothetical protein
MIKNIRYIALLLLLPAFSYAQVIIEGSGEIVATDDANIILEGDWTNNATNTGFTASTGTGIVYFHSANAQSIGGSKATAFGNITLRNISSASLTVNSDISIANVLNFYYSGIMHVGSGSITFLVDASTNNPSVSKFIDGPATYIGNKGFTFPIGDGAKWAPVRMYTPGSSVSVTAEYNYSAGAINFPPNSTSVSTPLVKVSNVEYWHITSTTSPSVRIRIFWKNGAESGIKSINSDSLKFAKYDGSNWVDEAATISASSTASGYISTTSALPLNDLYVTFGSTHNIANPLPIQLLSFTAQCRNQDVVVEWSTASEENNDYFTILRSDDAEHYEEIGTLPGAGNSNEVLNYSFTDWNAAGGNYYYMLKQTDYNGANETFNPVYVKCDNKEEVSLRVFYEGDRAYALLSNAENGSKYNVMLIDHTGRVVLQESIYVNSRHFYEISGAHLATGLYSIIWFTDEGSVRLNKKVFIK